MLTIQNCMKHDVVSIPSTATLAQAAYSLSVRRIGLLPVVNERQEVLGVLGLRDLLEMALPDFVRLLEKIDFIQDFGAVELTHPSQQELSQPVTRRMRPATTVQQNCGLLRAYALMREHDLHDLPVVDQQNRLVGIASHVDIGVAILSTWEMQT